MSLGEQIDALCPCRPLMQEMYEPEDDCGAGGENPCEENCQCHEDTGIHRQVACLWPGHALAREAEKLKGDLAEAQHRLKGAYG